MVYANHLDNNDNHTLLHNLEIFTNLTFSTQSTWYLKANGVVKSVGIIKFPTRPILAAPDEHYCEECVAGDGIRRTNALVLSAPRLVVA